MNSNRVCVSACIEAETRTRLTLSVVRVTRQLLLYINYLMTENVYCYMFLCDCTTNKVFGENLPFIRYSLSAVYRVTLMQTVTSASKLSVLIRMSVRIVFVNTSVCLILVITCRPTL